MQASPQVAPTAREFARRLRGFAGFQQCAAHPTPIEVGRFARWLSHPLRGGVVDAALRGRRAAPTVAGNAPSCRATRDFGFAGRRGDALGRALRSPRGATGPGSRVRRVRGPWFKMWGEINGIKPDPVAPHTRGRIPDLQPQTSSRLGHLQRSAIGEGVGLSQRCPALAEAVACANGVWSMGDVLETRAVLAASDGAKAARVWANRVTSGSINVPPCPSLSTG